VIYELRDYEVRPGRLGHLNARFREHAVPALERHGINPVGFFTNEIGGPSDRLLYLVSFDSLADREKAWASFGADEDWQRLKQEQEGDEPWTLRFTSRILKPTDYSPLA
jgi:hypothetical protein